MKKSKKSQEFLEELKNTPIISIACEKVGVSRNTIYRWQKEDPDFAILVESSIEDGRSFVSDIAENRLLKIIAQGNDLKAIIYWLRHHREPYSEKRNNDLENDNILRTRFAQTLVESISEVENKLYGKK